MFDKMDLDILFRSLISSPKPGITSFYGKPKKYICSIRKPLWLQRFPANIRIIIIISETMYLLHLLEMAERILGLLRWNPFYHDLEHRCIVSIN